jgi:hypothetical protein
MFCKNVDLRRLGCIALLLLFVPASLSAAGLFKKVKTYNSGGHFPNSVALADVNLDGKPDLVIANWCVAGQNGQGCPSGGVVGVLLGNGDGTFQSAKSFGSGAMGAVSVAVADVNGDAKPDILVANACNTQVCHPDGIGVLLGNGDAQTARIYVLDVVKAGEFVAVADVTGTANRTCW